MTTQVATLCERFVTELTRKWPCTRVLPKVVPQITAFLEHASAARVLALEEELDSLRLRVLLSNRLVPLLGDALECLVLVAPRIADLLQPLHQ